MTNHDKKSSSVGNTKSILKYRGSIIDYVRGTKNIIAYKQLAAYIMTYCILGLLVWGLYIGVKWLL